MSLSLVSLITIPGVDAQTVITVHLKDSLSFDPSAISVQPGEEVNVTLVNDGIVEHTFTLFAELNALVPLSDFTALRDYYQQAELIVDVSLQGGETGWAEFTAPIAPGNYILVCMVPGHAAGGMHGILTVGTTSPPGPGFSLEIGLVQAIMIAALAGTVVFGVFYHLRTSGPRKK
ncbi:MAG: plastocyanin/azurin family copper-binding protein [Thermoplasmata archaeon]